MAYTVPYSFSLYFDAINLPGDHRETANARRDDIVASLKDRLEILEAFSTGSIPRFTALKGDADLDLFVVLNYGKHIKGRSPAQVLQDVQDALRDFRTNVRKNGQAITLYYKTWPNVDIVPAARVADGEKVVGFEIPNANQGTWISTDPRKHSSAIDSRASVCGPSFRQLIKMMKHWSRHHGDYLQSYHIEVMALQAFTSRLSNDSWDAFQFFEKVRELAKAPLWHEGSFVDAYLSYDDRAEVKRRLEGAADKARDAWYYTYPPRDDHERAITLWKQLLGDPFPAYGG